MTRQNEDAVSFFVGLNRAIETARKHGVEVKALAAEAYLRGFNAGFDAAKNKRTAE